MVRKIRDVSSKYRRVDPLMVANAIGAGVALDLSSRRIQRQAQTEDNVKMTEEQINAGFAEAARLESIADRMRHDLDDDPHPTHSRYEAEKLEQRAREILREIEERER